MTLLATELLKLRTLRGTWVLSGVAVLLAGLLGLAIGLNVGTGGRELAGSEARQAFATGYVFSYLFAVVLGVLLVTGEFRHGLATPTFLATPRRGRVVAAKAEAALVLGLAIGVLAVGACAGLVAVLLSGRGVPVRYDAGLIGAIAAPLLLCGVYCVLGAALGFVVRNQVGALVSALALFFVLPILAAALVGLVSGLPQTLPLYLPDGAGRVLTGIDPALSPWVGAVTLAGYLALLLAVGAAVTRRRDV